jgi:serine/threonine protein kinase
MKKLTQAISGVKDPLADYKILDPADTCAVGHGCLWTATRAIDRATKQPVTVLALKEEDVVRRLTGDPVACADVIQRAVAGMRTLAKIRHPSFVRVLKGIEDDRPKKRFIMVVEAITTSLDSHRRQRLTGGSSSSPTGVPVMPAPFATAGGAPKRPVAAAQPDFMDEVVGNRSAVASASSATDAHAGTTGPETIATEVGLCTIAKGIAFLHDAVGMVHLNLAPESLVVCAATALSLPSSSNDNLARSDSSGQLTGDLEWRILDLTFAVPIAELSAIPPTFNTYFTDARRQMPRNSILSPLRCPDLNFAAPSYVQRGDPGLRADLWSLGCLVHWALSESVADEVSLKVNAANDLAIYDRHIAKLQAAATGGSATTGRLGATAANALDFFSSGPSPSTSSPPASVTGMTVASDVDALCAPEFGVQNNPRGVSPYQSFSDFLNRSVLHSQRAKTITEFAGLATLSPEEKLGTLARMYKLIDQLSSAVLQSRVIPPLTQELENPKMYRFIVPLLLKAVPRMSKEAIECCARPPLLLSLRSTDPNVVAILLEDFRALRKAAALDTKVCKCVADWLVTTLANRGLRFEVVAQCMHEVGWLYDAQSRLVDTALVELSNAMLHASRHVATDDPQRAGALRCIETGSTVLVRGTALAAVPALDEQLAPLCVHLLRECAGRQGAELPVLRVLRAVAERVSKHVLVSLMQPLCHELSTHPEHKEFAAEAAKVAHFIVDHLANRGS